MPRVAVTGPNSSPSFAGAEAVSWAEMGVDMDNTVASPMAIEPVLNIFFISLFYLKFGNFTCVVVM
jgi:hypothetical protein